MPPAIAEIFKNKEVIAFDRDALGRQGMLVSPAGKHEVWASRLQDGSRTVVLLNRRRKAAAMSVSVKETGLDESAHLRARDLWSGKDLNLIDGRYTLRVPAHGTVMLRISAFPGLQAGATRTE